jgi:signal transduction histidine kinase
LTNILEKRLSVHRHLAQQTNLNDKLHEEIKQLQSLANVGMVSAMAAHEINNILTPLANYARLSMKYPDDTELAAKAIKKAIANTEKASKILQSLLALANGKPQNKDYYSLKGLIEEVFDCLGRDFTKDGIKVLIDIPRDLQLWTDSASLQQVFMNLILNARDAMIARGGTLKITAEKTSDSLLIRISDTGCGIESDNLKKIFEPFFSTKTRTDYRQSGAGLGLCFCKRIVQEHDGMISVESQPDKGTTFKVCIPSL